MVSSKSLLFIAVAITHTHALPFNGLLHFGRRATNYSVIGPEPTHSVNAERTVTTTVTVTAVPQAPTVFVSSPPTTVTTQLVESTSWYDDGMWKTSYFTRVPATTIVSTSTPTATPSSTTTTTAIAETSIATSSTNASANVEAAPSPSSTTAPLDIPADSPAPTTLTIEITPSSTPDVSASAPPTA